MNTLRAVLAPYERPILAKTLWQLGTSVLPFVLTWWLAFRLLEVGFWPSFACRVLATGFLLRIYIVQHDCGHHSLFRSARVNDAVGCILGVVTLLPYYRWRHDHALHHASSGNLERRGNGDVWTMTVGEYRSANRWQRFRYRAYRHPCVLFGLAPLFLFVVLQRAPGRSGTRRERLSVRGTNLALLVTLGTLCRFLGWRAVFAIEGTITWLGSTIAVWLFYIQHQFEDTYWARAEDWDFGEAGLRGASYYALPGWLHWFTGNIGFHHVHHLSPRIPNYELARCMRENPVLQAPRTLTLRSAFASLWLGLWDEQQGRLVSWGEARRSVGNSQPLAI